MRRLFIKLMLLLVLLAVVIPFALPLRDGKPLLSLSAIKWPTLPEVKLPKVELPQSLDLSGDGATGPVTVYRWRDSDGAWQYSSTPPAAGIAYESRTVDTATNVVPALVPAAPAAPAAAAEEKKEDKAAAPAAPSPYSPEGVKKLFEDARGVREQSHERERIRDQL